MAARKKSSARKGASRKAPAKKAGGKTASPKKAAKKKAPAKKKKAAAKKSAAKKSAAKKAAAAPKKAAKKAAAASTPAPAAKKKAVKKAAAPAAVVDTPKPSPLPKMPKMPPRRKDGTITLAFGAECDQAFMVYALAAGKVDTEDRKYELVRSDVQKLDQDALEGRFDVTAVTYGGYPALRSRYLALSCGGSYGDHTGPLLVARRPIRAGEVDGLEVAVPGTLSTAAIALRLWLPQAGLDLKAMPTREISLRVRAGHVRSGVIINEDQVTYRNHNLIRVVDLGQWWGEMTEGLPLALGTNAIRRDISFDERAKIALDLKRSIAYALGHREEALDWAAQYAPNREREVLDAYVSRYVNDLSLDCGERGRQAARLLFQEAYRLGIVDELIEPVFHGDEEAAAAAEIARKAKEKKKAAAAKKAAAKKAAAEKAAAEQAKAEADAAGEDPDAESDDA